LDTYGQHLLAEYFGCDPQVLNDPIGVEEKMRQAAVAAGANIVASAFHRFAPQGVSGVVVIEESHLSIHTWPETGYAAVDFYTCGQCLPERSHRMLLSALRASGAEVMLVERGLECGHALKLRRHYYEPSGAADAKERTYGALVR
jgi:S-adenosylmethionine decarboxylase